MQAGALNIKLMADIVDVQRKMAQVQQLAEMTAGRMASAFSGLGAQIGGALSVGAIVAFFKQINDGIDKLNDLADATGSTVEKISALEAAAVRTGGNIDQVGSAMVKLNQVLKDAKETDGASLALNAIGLEAKALRQLDPADAVMQVAVALAQFEDDGNKARIVQELFGKSARELAPLLKDLAEQGMLQATVTQQQADQADALNRQFAAVRVSATNAGRAILSDLTPTLVEIFKVFNQAGGSAKDFSGIVSVLRVPLEALAVLGANIAFVFAGVGREIGALAAQAVQLARGNWSGVAAIRDAVIEDGKRARAELEAFEQRVLSAGTVAAQAQAEAASAAKKGLPDIVVLTQAQTRQDEQAKAAAKAREAEADRQSRAHLAWLKRVDEAEEAAEKAAQAELKRMADLQQAELELAASRQLRQVAAYEAEEQAIDARLKSAGDMLQAIERETQALSMSNTEREVSNALLELERLGLEKGTYAYEEYARKIREAIVNRENVRASIEQTQQIQREWERMSDQIGQSLTDALMQGGKSAWEYIKGLFRSMVLRPIIQAVVNPVVGAAQAAVGSALGLSAGSAAAGSAFGNAAGAAIGSAIFGSSAAYGAAIGTTNIAAGSQAAMLAAQTGSFGAAGVTATSSAAAGAGSGFMSTAAAAGPYVLAALAILNAAGVFRSKKIVGGGLTGTLGAGDIQSYDLQRRGGTLFSGPEYSMVNQRMSAESQAIQAAYEALRTNAANMAEALGLSSDAVKTFTTQLGTDVLHNDLAARGIKLDGLTPEEAAQKVQAALSQANEDLAAFVLGASRTVTETITTSVEDWAEGEQGRWMRGYVEQVSQVTRTIEATGPSFARTGETAVQTLTRLASSISTINPVLELLGLQLFDTSLAGADLASTMADAFGGLENFTQVTAQYYQEFFSEAERTAHVTAQLTEALGGMGMTLPTTRDAFRDLVEAQDLTTEAGRKNFATLMQLSGSFAAITPVLEKVADAGETVTETLRSAADILNERQGLERQLLQLQGDTAALRALDRAALDASNRALFDQITALEDAQAATAAAAQAAQEAADAERTLAAERNRIAQERAGLERQLLQLQGDTTALRALDRGALDASNRALFDQITALEDAQAATAAAAQAAQEAADAERALAAERDRIAQERAGLERQLLQLQGDTTALRALDRGALDASNRALFDQITALEDAQAATAAAAQAAQEAADAERALAAERDRIAQERAGLERQLLQLQGDTTALRALDRVALDASNRALFDQITALEDAQAATAAAAQAAQEAADAERALAAERERIAQERAGLERQLLQLQGDTTALRALDRAALDASNRALFDQITALQDSQAAAAAAADAERSLAAEREAAEAAAAESLRRAASEFAALRQQQADAAASATNAAFEAVRRAIDAEAQAAEAALTSAYKLLTDNIERQKQAATAAKEAATETLQAARSIFEYLGDQIEQLRGAAGAGMSGAEGRAFIDQAITAARSTGTLPDQEALAAAVSAARGELDASRYASAFDLRRDSLILASRLNELQKAAGTQASVAERALSVAEEQLKQLEDSAELARVQFELNLQAVRDNAAAQLAGAQAQLDALRGIDSRMLSVAEAIGNLATAIITERAAVAAAAAAQSQAAKVSPGSRSSEQLQQMLPGDWYTQYDAAEKIDWFNANRVSVSELASAGSSLEDIQWMLQNGYRGFANGGMHQGGLRLVGERGPELEVTGPSRIYSYEQTRDMLGSGQRRDETLVAEIRSLREENAAQARAMVSMQQRMTRLIERWDGDGIPETRAVA